MLTTAQVDEFRTTGLLRLPGALPQEAAETMCDRLWEFLAARDGIHRDERSTWTVESPTGFQPVTHAGVFRAFGETALRCASGPSQFWVTTRSRVVRARWTLARMASAVAVQT